MAGPAPLSMTLGDLMTNPPGRGTRQVSARYREIAALEAVYRRALADPARAPRFRLGAWELEAGRSYLAWVRVPSESCAADFDVVLRLDYAAGAATRAAAARVYCDSPSWVFTYGYVAARRGLLAPGWEAALGQAASERPRTTNPDETYGFDKVVQQACYYLLGRGGMLTSRDAARIAAATRGRPPSPSDPALSAEGKLAEYGREQERARAARREARGEEKRRKEEAARSDAAERGARARGAPAGAKPGRAAGVPAAKAARGARATRPAGRAGAAAGAPAAGRRRT